MSVTGCSPASFDVERVSHDVPPCVRACTYARAPSLPLVHYAVNRDISSLPRRHPPSRFSGLLVKDSLHFVAPCPRYYYYDATSYIVIYDDTRAIVPSA